MWRSTKQLHGSGLTKLITAVSAGKVKLSPDDVYKICAIFKAKEDTLLLQTNNGFISGVYTQYQKMDPDTVTPFQRTFIDGAFAALPAGPLGRSADKEPKISDVAATIKDQPVNDNHTADTTPIVTKMTTQVNNTTAILNEQLSVDERIAAIWDVVHEYKSSNFLGSDGIRKINKHCKALELQLRQMKPFEVASLLKALGTINYQDYTFTNLLARRSCEVASKFSLTELCKSYFNLSKLQNHDSMVAFVNQIELQMEKLHWEHVQFVALALERQPQISSAPARMVPKLLSRAVAHFSEVDSAVYHRALLAVAARYNMRRHPDVAKILYDSTKHLERISERDILSILQSLVDLSIPAGTAGLAELLEKTESLVHSLDIRNIDSLMDILSVLPVPTERIMTKLMNRLVVDAGKLSIPQLTFILHLLSSYPSAKGDASIATLAFASFLRAESFDGDALEQVVLNLAQLNHFSDDFYGIVLVLLNNKGGFRSFDTLAALMKCCTREVVEDARGQEMITKGILALAPTMNDEQLVEIRKLLIKLGVNDTNVHQMIFRQAKRLQRESGNHWSRRGRNASDDFI